MQVSLDKRQPLPAQKIRNILIRSSEKQRTSENIQHPERSYILRYAPKYYKNLTIEITPFTPLLSKIKKIKKLKKFEGRTREPFKGGFPQILWLNLLANNRKEIEESPELVIRGDLTKRSKSFWKRFYLQKIKLFPNIVRILLSKWNIYLRRSDFNPSVPIKELFIQHIWNLRRLKSLEILVRGDNYEQAKWIFERLNGMSRFLGRLETLIVRIENEERDIQELFQNKNVFFHVTHLSLPEKFEPIFAEIPQMRKNLKSLSLEFQYEVDENPEFRNLLASIQHLDQLRRLVFVWPRDAKNLWGYFKPPSSLRQLRLNFTASNLMNEGLFVENKDVVSHWEDIHALDMLELRVTCEKAEEIIFVKQFITMILKKVRRLRSLRYYQRGQPFGDEPFSIEEVPHLYETLEKFEHWVPERCSHQESPKFDLKMLKPFRNLKELKLDGTSVVYENVEEVVSLLEENQKDGETAILEVRTSQMSDQNWLGGTLKKIEKIKREDKNLKISFDLGFKAWNFVVVLEKLCKDIEAVKTIKGLVMYLTLFSDIKTDPLPVEELKKVFDRYAEISNLRVFVCNSWTCLKYEKMDGQKVQFHL